MARGITGFSLDLYRRGDVLERAVLALSRSIAVVALRICTITRVPNFLLLVHRSSNDFISPDHYRRFSHPGIRLVAEELSSAGTSVPTSAPSPAPPPPSPSLRALPQPPARSTRRFTRLGGHPCTGVPCVP
ncbi:MAG: hypothetical protein JRJ84_24570 [Deltaproteobacteria bacterium]|nr:hypothetical protein [Deltaproteobacteria bacterium]